jgi:hypothetical protein
MAYMSQEKKTALAPGIKAVLKKYGMKGTISVDNHSTLVCTVSEGPLDVIGNMYEIAMTKPETFYARDKAPKPLSIEVNPYWISENYSGKVLAFVQALKDAMQGPDWYDRSDIQTDYFDTAWYICINIGKWNKPFRCTA